jgi:hypothetical protein
MTEQALPQRTFFRQYFPHADAADSQKISAPDV